MKDCSKLLMEADELMEWAQTRCKVLEYLVNDHKYLDQSPNNKILFVVDVFDVLKLAFPFADLKSKRRGDLDSRERDELLSGQLARSCLFLNLPTRGERTYYPLLMPSPYLEEFLAGLNSPKIVSPRPDTFSSRFARLQAELKTLLGDKPLSILREMGEKVGFEAIVKLCPELLFALTGHIDKGIGVLETLFRENKLTLNFTEWTPLDKHYRERLFDGAKFRGFDFLQPKEDAEWQTLLENTLFKDDLLFHATYLSDIRAIRFVRYLNEQLNPHQVLVLYVSGAGTIESLFRSEAAWKKASAWWVDADGEKHHTCFFRGLDVFRFYLRYCDCNPNDAIPAKIIESATKDMKMLEEFIAKKTRDTISNIRLFGVSRYSDDFDILEASMQSVQGLRETLQSLHMTQSSREFMDSYQMGNIDLLRKETYSGPQAVAQGELSRYADLITSVLEAASDFRRPEIVEQIVRVKVLLTNEFLNWRNLSDVYSRRSRLEGGSRSDARIADRAFRKYFINFIMFPFRVHFQTPELANAVGALAEEVEAILYDGRYDNVTARNFYSSLMNLASKCAIISGSKDNFWGKQLDVADTSDKGIERRLTMLVLLLALGNTKEVIDDSERLLGIKDVPLALELRLIKVQAKLRVLLRRESKKGDETAEMVSDIVSSALESFRMTESTDPRFLYLAAFAVGTQAGSGWHSDYSRSWVIGRCFEVLSLLGRPDSSNDSLDWFMSNLESDKRHLAESVLASLSYYLAVDGDRSDVMEALRIHQHAFLMKAKFTGLCLYDKAFVYRRLMEFAENESELDDYYAKCLHYYSLARERLFTGSSVQDAKKRTAEIKRTLLADLSRKKTGPSL